MHIVQMRAMEDATSTKQKITEIFPEAKIWHFPLAELKLLPLDTLMLSSSTHLILTSKNAIRWLIAQKIDCDYIISCVGEQTAALARFFGYHHIKYVAKNAASLMEIITKEPKNTHFVYLRGKTVRHDLCYTLKNAGYENVQEHIVYDLLSIDQPFKKLPKELYQAPVVFLLYSYKQSLALYQQLDLKQFHHATIIAISRYVAKPFINVPDIRVLCAKSPNESAMLDCLLLVDNT